MVIDVLRATTVVVHALAHGARAVVPAASIEEAHRAAARWPASERLLGGERQGVRIEGFDLDNSPEHYSPEVVAGKTIILTTTNGTRALRWAEQAEQILIGSFNNLSAIIEILKPETRPVHLLCAGTDHRITGEDLLVAGAIADGCQSRFTIHRETQIMIDFWRQHGNDSAHRLAVMRDSAGGRNLVDLGYDRDIARASEIDRFSLVPRLDRVTGELR